MSSPALESALQSINAAVTPALLFTASGLLLAGLQGKYSVLISAIRGLNDERRQLLLKPQLAPLEKARQQSVASQITHLLSRVKLLRNAIFSLYLGTLLFLIASVVIGLTYLGWPPMAWLVLSLFGAGLAGLVIGVFYALIDARQSYRGVLLEVNLPESAGPL